MHVSLSSCSRLCSETLKSLTGVKCTLSNVKPQCFSREMEDKFGACVWPDLGFRGGFFPVIVFKSFNLWITLSSYLFLAPRLKFLKMCSECNDFVRNSSRMCLIGIFMLLWNQFHPTNMGRHCHENYFYIDSFQVIIIVTGHSMYDPQYSSLSSKLSLCVKNSVPYTLWSMDRP